jgi:hypothetical protein
MPQVGCGVGGVGVYVGSLFAWIQNRADYAHSKGHRRFHHMIYSELLLVACVRSYSITFLLDRLADRGVDQRTRISLSHVKLIVRHPGPIQSCSHGLS